MFLGGCMEKMYLAKSNAEVVFVADEKLSLARIAQEAQNYLCQEEDYKYIEFIEINDTKFKNDVVWNNLKYKKSKKHSHKFKYKKKSTLSKEHNKFKYKKNSTFDEEEFY